MGIDYSGNVRNSWGFREIKIVYEDSPFGSLVPNWVHHRINIFGSLTKALQIQLFSAIPQKFRWMY